MHETSIINGIYRTLKQEFEAEKLNKMTGIYVRVGILSNIEPRLLMNAYEASHMTNPSFQNVKLNIEMLALKIQCERCNHITDVKQYRFLCDKCQIPSKNVIQGEEMLIHKVEFDD
ncbi:hydrogenase maturation nickel metallochaperone HypA/HybF [Winogradskyella schleiferi]|jgi:hydrogenase nickel incorporation protein HypA/HybF|uniref:hydrogenase maturation nickel metallochaperone HypA/HybF n=1 Tax=Winogradskyella schleiferi TaxID=2686078 RepID=UPI0015BF21CA|nr:hydrogenase maturation nickel metallochaperone HypA [Winogradskyella schleiferi]|tara:strand:+ start:5645 stop:5992 length:348 start_codon:yes stop_codon:yes gene_type:complete